MNWISVKDRLPPLNDGYLVHQQAPGYEKKIWIAYFYKSEWVSSNGNIVPFITHWMQLPQPPENN